MGFGRKKRKRQLKNFSLVKKLIFIVGLLLFVNLAVLGYFFLIAAPPEDNLRVIFLDIGQGDAALIQTPGGHNILVDGGPDKNIIYKLDKYIPINNRKIDLMVLTHFGLDHLSGLVEVLKRYPVKQVAGNGLKDFTSAALEWGETVKQKNIPQQTVDAPQQIALDNKEVLMDFFWPVQSRIKGLNGDDNFASVVFKLTYGDNSFLFTGDADKEVERILTESGYDLSAEVLKVGHHGSKYSSGLDFLQSVKPRYGVISVGENSFSHPSLRILTNLKQVAAEILRTDELGDIIFFSDGEKLGLTFKK